MSVKVYYLSTIDLFMATDGGANPIVLKKDHDEEIAKLEARCKELEDAHDKLVLKNVELTMAIPSNFRLIIEDKYKLESENRIVKAKLEKARDLFSYEVDRNGCSDEIVAADTTDEHEVAVERYVVEHFDNALKELDSIE